MIAFWALNTERPIGGQTFGPIPWSKVYDYGRLVLRLPEELMELLWAVISAMDSAFLGWQKQEHDRHVRMNSSSGKSKGKSATRATYSR